MLTFFLVVPADWTKFVVPGNEISHLEVLSPLSDAEWTQIMDALKASKTLQSLVFSNGTMPPFGVTSLGQALSVNKSLVKLGLRGTGQNAETVRFLFESLSDSVQSAAFAEALEAQLEGVPPSATPFGVETIDLGQNPLGDDGVIALASLLKKTHVRSLNIDQVGLTTEGFKRFFAELPKGISGTTIRSKNIITRIAFALESLSLSGNAPGLEGVKAVADFLGHNSTLTTLILRNSQLGDNSVLTLTKSLDPSDTLSRLAVLDLCDNQIGRDGASHLTSLLSRNHLIVTVRLDNNPLPDDARQALDQLTSANQALVDARSMAPWKSEATISIQGEDGTPIGVTCATVLSNGLVFIGTSYGEVYVWNPSADEGSSKTVPSLKHSVSMLMLSSDPGFLRHGKIEAKIVTYEPESRPTKRRINALIDNQDGTIWCVTDERSVTIIGIIERAVLKRLPLHKYQAISISKFGLDIYLGGATGEVSLWRSDSHACRHEIVLDGRYPISAIHSDGQYIYVCVLVHPSRAGHVLMFSPAMELLQHFEAHTDFISSIQTLNGKIITSSWDKTVKIWSIDTASQLVVHEHTLDKHHARVTSVVTSNDRVISASDDNTLIVWDITKPRESMLEKRMLGAWGGNIYNLQAAHNKLVSCSHKEGRVTLWSLS